MTLENDGITKAGTKEYAIYTVAIHHNGAYRTTNYVSVTARSTDDAIWQAKQWARARGSWDFRIGEVR